MKWMVVLFGRLLRLALFAQVMAFLGACNIIEPERDRVDEVLVYLRPDPLVVGDTLQAAAGAFYGGHAIRFGAPIEPSAFRWRSSAPGIVSISRRGVLIGHSPGTVTITAEFLGVSGATQGRVVGIP